MLNFLSFFPFYETSNFPCPLRVHREILHMICSAAVQSISGYSSFVSYGWPRLNVSQFPLDEKFSVRNEDK